MAQTRKNAINNQSYLKRLKTLSSDRDFATPRNQNNKEFIRNRLKTLSGNQPWVQISIDKPYKTYSQCNNVHSQNRSNEEEEEDHKKNPYWDKPSFIANDFIEQIERIQQNKSDTYRKLRGKLVKKYPSYKKKYETTGQQIQCSSKVSQNNSVRDGMMNSMLKTTNKSFLSRENQPKKQKVSYFRNIKFYSRSKKRCMTDYIENQELIEKKAQIEIPKLSYFQYLRHSQQRKKLQYVSALGSELSKKRQNILSIQKQGTQSYARLKKSLEEAIDSCKIKV